jgi:heme/copper-type cytochrome/quinol oxidase subunit 2
MISRATDERTPAVRKRCAVALAVAAVTATTLGCSPNQRPSTATTTEETQAAPTATAVSTTTVTTTLTATPQNSSQTTTSNGQVIRVTVTGGQVTPAPALVDVKLGSTVVIEVTSDVAEQLHVLGYERTLDLQPGQPGRLQLTASNPGTFTVELARAHRQLFQLRVQ